jgi:PPOX class probable F420-dependent enzyme
MGAFPDASTPFGRRVRERLTTDIAIWLITVSVDGTPQPNPVWYLWSGEEILVYNRLDAKRLTHLRTRPRVSLHTDGDRKGGEVIVLAGTAAVEPHAPGPDTNDAYVAKYGDAMVRVSGSLSQFGVDYPRLTRITINKVRGF